MTYKLKFSLTSFLPQRAENGDKMFILIQFIRNLHSLAYEKILSQMILLKSLVRSRFMECQST